MIKEQTNRLKEIYRYLLGKGYFSTQKEFAGLIDYDPATVNQALKGNPKQLTNNFLLRVSRRFPEISSNWLIDGVDDMLNPVVNTQSGTENVNIGTFGGGEVNDTQVKYGKVSDSVEKLERSIHVLEAMVREKDNIIREKDNIIKELKRQIEELKKDKQFLQDMIKNK